MKSGKPLVLVVSRRTTVKRGDTVKRSGPARPGSHLRLVAVDGVSVAGPAPKLLTAPAASSVQRRRVERRRPPRSLSRPFGQRVVQAANDVAVLALALLSGLRPLA